MSLNILQNVNLAEYTSWKIGGPADYFCLPASLEELQQALRFIKENHLKWTILGGGSNVLIADEGIEGMVICLKKFSSLNYKVLDNKLKVQCLAGTSKMELLKLFLKYQLPAALFLAGLPGDVGGGVVMNAGVAENYSPREFMEIVDAIDVMDKDGNCHHLKKEQLEIKYRHTKGWQPHIVVQVYISIDVKADSQVIQKVREANKARSQKQPLDKPSCGSVFKNSENYKAAQVIDQCSLKGFNIGDAQVSLKHANFIVNTGKATAVDTWNVIKHVQQTVKNKLGFELQTEVVRLGRWDLDVY